MLSATTVEARPGVPRVQTVVVVRRRKVLSVLLGSAAGCALVAAAGLSAAWWLAGFLAMLAAGYVGKVTRLRHLRVRRQIDHAFGSDLQGPDQFDWRALEQELHLAMAPADVARATVPASPREVGNRELARFLLCWALGWVLTPVVAVIRLVQGDLSILERHGVASRIVRLQQYGRSQSLRLLTVGAAASVGITAVGGLATGAGATTTVAAISTTTQAAGAPAASTYSVVPGDTLSSIARRSRTSVGALAATNHLANPNLIFPGQVLSIAGRGPAITAATTVAAITYVVRAGDTLSSIARAHGTTVTALVSTNGVANPNLIFPGQVLTLPAGTGPAAAAPAGTGMPAPTPSAPNQSAPAGGRYIVRPGDTLAALARRYGTTVAFLAATNHVANPNLIYQGQTLTVPSGTNTQDPAPSAPAAATSSPAPAPAPVAPAPGPAPPAPPIAVVAASTSQSALPLPAQYLHGGSVDQGVDYSAPGGTPLYAMGPGQIIREGMSGFGPNTPVLEITAGPLAGKTVYYGHAGADLVPVGATVAAGQQISVVGYGIVGYSTGPHLEIGFYPPGGNGSGQAMLDYLNGAAGHPTGG